MERSREQTSPFAARDVQILSLDEFHALASQGHGALSDAQTRYLLGFSVLAPTSHNSVPQAYALEETGQSLAVYLQRGYVLAASDPTGEEALISVGCALESFILAAAQYGVEYAWWPAPGLCWNDCGPGPATSVSLVGTLCLNRLASAPAESARQRTLSALVERQMVRAEYDRALPLTPDLARLLTNSAGAARDATLLLFHSAAQKFAWAKLDELSLKHKLEEKSFRLELGAWLLPNEDVRSTRGMRGSEFGLDDRLAAELSAQLRGDAPLETDQLANLARASRVGLVSSSSLAVLCTQGNEPDSAVQAGRAFLRAAVTLSEHGWCCAVHTAVCQVPYARAMAMATLTGGKRPKVVFRVGKPLNPDHARRPRSSRPSLDQHLLPRAWAISPRRSGLPLLHQGAELLSRPPDVVELEAPTRATSPPIR